MFKKIISIGAGMLVSVSAFAGGNADVATKFDGPSGMGQYIIYAPHANATNMIFATNGTVSVPGVLTVGTVVTNGVISGALSLGSTLAVTGASSFTGISSFTAVPNFKAALTAAGTLTNGAVSTKLPATTSNTNGVWMSFSGNGTNYAVLAFPQ